MRNGDIGKRVRAAASARTASFSSDEAETPEPHDTRASSRGSSAHTSVPNPPSPPKPTASSRAAKLQARRAVRPLADEPAPPDTETERAGSKRCTRSASTTVHWQTGMRKTTQKKAGVPSSPRRPTRAQLPVSGALAITTRSKARRHSPQPGPGSSSSGAARTSSDEASELILQSRQRSRHQAARRVNTRSQQPDPDPVHSESSAESPTLMHVPAPPGDPTTGVVTRSMARRLQKQDPPQQAPNRSQIPLLKPTVSSLSASTAASDATAPLSTSTSASQGSVSTPPPRKPSHISSFPQTVNAETFDTPENHFRHVRRSPQFNYDRFIPARSPELGSDFRLHESQRASSPVFSRRAANIEHRIQVDEANRTYDALLRSELLNDRSAVDEFEQARLRSSSPPPRRRQDIYRLSSSPNQLPSLVPWSSSAGPSSRPATPQPSSPHREPVFIYKSPRKAGHGMASSLPSGPRNLFGRVSPVHEVYQQSKLTREARRILSPRPTSRRIQKDPVKVLDAPGIRDDYYLNLMDWSSANQVSVALNSEVYVWDAKSSETSRLCDVNTGETEWVTAVRWAESGKHLAVGLNSGAVQIWDVNQGRKIRTFNAHTRRVGVVEWNQSVVSTGGRDKRIYNHDIRMREGSVVSTFYGHEQEVCGLRWSPDRTQLASGGNDNQLLVWDMRFTPLDSLVPSYHPEIAAAARTFRRPLFRLTEHMAAVKALAWSPTQAGLLASGGGTDDRCIRLWNTHTGQQVSWHDTKSQVCNLSWSHDGTELVSTHGYSENHIILWKYPAMQPMGLLSGHTKRVLYLAHSPDGQTIATAAGDETIRFWEVFAKSTAASGRAGALASSMTRLVGLPGAGKDGGVAGGGIMLDDLAHIR